MDNSGDGKHGPPNYPPPGRPGCPKGNTLCWGGAECPCDKDCCCGEPPVSGPQGCKLCPLPPGTPGLSSITCPCGGGYYKPDGTWVSGADVQAGRAPPKPDTTLPSPVTTPETQNTADKNNDSEALSTTG